ncbi:hypothetical protein ACJX0J_015356, partial [Zea mays]
DLGRQRGEGGVGERARDQRVTSESFLPLGGGGLRPEQETETWVASLNWRGGRWRRTRRSWS